MISSQQLANDLLQDEGFKLFVYDDATGRAIVPGYTLLGHPTIGIGRALDTNGVSPYEANVMLNEDCFAITTWCESQLAYYAALSYNRQIAIANMVFQIGRQGFLLFRHLQDAAAAGDWQGVVDAMQNSLWHTQTPERAERIEKLFLQG